MKPNSNPKCIGVYCLHCSASGRAYFGSSYDVFRRIKNHLAKLGKGRHEVTAMQNDWNLHGHACFQASIVTLSRTIAIARKLEISIIAAQEEDSVYNSTHVKRRPPAKPNPPAKPIQPVFDIVDIDDLASVAKTAKRFGVDRRTIYAWLKMGHAPLGVTVCGKPYFFKSAFDQFVPPTRGRKPNARH